MVQEPYTRLKGATGEANGSSPIFVADISSRIGNGFQQNKFSCRSVIGEPWRLVEATGLDTEPLHLATTQLPGAARGNLRGGINKARVDAHGHDVAPQRIIGLFDFAAGVGINWKLGAWVDMACRGANQCIDARRSTARSAEVQPCLVLAL